MDSRRRLLRARDEEKSRFAEALRRTVLPHLLPLPSRLAELAAGLAGDGSADARELDLQPERDATNAALEDLRSLVRGTGRRQSARRRSVRCRRTTRALRAGPARTPTW